MAKFDLYLLVDNMFCVTVDAENSEDAERIVQEEMTFADVLEASGVSLSEICYSVDEVNESR